MNEYQRISADQAKLYAHLVAAGKVSAQVASNQPTSDNRAMLIPDISRVVKDDLAVAEAVAAVLDCQLITAVEEGVAIHCPGGGSNWLVHGNFLCLANPFDRDLIGRATAWARSEKLDDLRRAVISQTYLGQLRAVHGASFEGDDNADIDEKLALQHVDDIIREAAAKDASDVHFSPTQTDKVDLLYRIDGALRIQRKIELKLFDSIVRSLMDRCNVIYQASVSQDAKFDLAIDQNKTINLRLSLIPVVRMSEKSQKMVLRLLGNNKSLANIDRLGLSPKNRDLFYKFSLCPTGMVVLTGPTGSGKTTTLTAQLLNMQSHNPNRNYHTIEDPVEQQHEGMSHTEVNAQVSFSDALKAMLRQDPDVMLVGEMRDEETAKLSFTAAMTGHLILTTLHTNSAHESIGRLQDMGIDKEKIVTNTLAFVAQRLCRALCNKCKVQYRLKDDPKRLSTYGDHEVFRELKGETVLYRANPNGCNECGQAVGGGTKGRRGITEVLEITRDVQYAILNGVSPSILRNEQILNGSFLDLWDDALRLILDGSIGFEQAEEQLNPFEHDHPLNMSSSAQAQVTHQVPMLVPRASAVNGESLISQL